ncbi:MAG TPA: glycoside hydrolase family 3 N-terminal domain-containing protein [Anaerolineaceae bacterium]|nr:glycoside hydrolase family 3 N-terminal domain-containing protein [Anaerolineaceae bacterium]HPN54152.1 glycoside hydrolase family 3 N-terminal domain-containing protein [Anaerolineaceae bacterium]
MNLKYRIFSLVLVICLALSACQQPTAVPTPAPTAAPTQAPVEAPTAAPVEPTAESPALYLDPAQPPAARAADLLSRMTLDEKLGQMAQVEKGSIAPADVTKYGIGSILSGGGGYPQTNSAEAWAKMVDGFQAAALETRLAIPMIYGVDAVHGHNNLKGATIFPHNIGLGAANDPDLMQRIGRATAEEMAATGIRWNFAPVLAVVQDIRWGRTYESYGENTDLVTSLGTAYVKGLQQVDAQGSLANPLAVIASIKHFIGDGATKWGTATSGANLIDRGDMQVDEATLRARFLPPYASAIKAGARTLMVSFSSWNGTKMHAQKALITDLVKGELGFTGFVVSDWQAIDEIPGNFDSDVVTSINAGLDMIMVPYDYKTFLTTLKKAVESGQIPQARIDDAVLRILTVKFEMGLFEHPYSDPANLSLVGSEAHRALAREAVAKSLVLLKNDNQALPLAKNTPVIFVAGEAANDIGTLCGGWTIEWQGKAGDITPGTTLLDAIKSSVTPESQVFYNRFGKFENQKDANGNSLKADIGIVVVGEKPYAEFQGDSNNLALSDLDMANIERMRASSQKLIIILVSGRPMIINDALESADAFVAAWLPGTEAAGITDVLFGDQPFTGKLPFTWPRSMDQIPFDFNNLPTGADGVLFPYGYGLSVEK